MFCVGCKVGQMVLESQDHGHGGHGSHGGHGGYNGHGDDNGTGHAGGTGHGGGHGHGGHGTFPDLEMSLCPYHVLEAGSLRMKRTLGFIRFYP